MSPWRNVGVDFVNHDDDYSKYKVLIAPLIYGKSRLGGPASLVRQRGGVITTFRSKESRIGTISLQISLSRESWLAFLGLK